MHRDPVNRDGPSSRKVPADVDFELTEEQRGLREVARSMLAASNPPQLVRSLAESGTDVDEKLWQRGAELGWLGLVVPEDQGGAGQGVVELVLVAQELGRAAAAGPFLDTALTAMALAKAAGFADLVAGLAEGRLRASRVGQGVVATGGPHGDLVLDGRAPVVQAAASADWLLVTALDPASGHHLALVEASRVMVRSRRTLDLTRRWYDITFDGLRIPAADVVASDKAEVQWLSDAAAVLTAADALGAGEWLLDATVGYLKVREQFDRPLGSFQSAKHKAADMLIALRAAASATYYAAMALDAHTPDAALSASVAKTFTADAVGEVAGEALQTHGGIGFTWEHDLHLYLRRAKAGGVLEGTTAEHQERIVALSE